MASAVTSSERARLEEHRRLRRVLANQSSTPFEREVAQISLDRLEERAKPPTCPHCLDTIDSHGGAICRVVVRFQRRAGKTVLPTATQSAELRKAYADEEAALARGQRKRDAKSRQTGLF